MNQATEQTEGSHLPLRAAADLQDHLMSASNDLERLHALLEHACDVLARSFYGASEQVRAMMDSGGHHAAHDLMQHLVPAVTALQFQDLASQLIHHTNRRLKSCADQIAQAAMDDDDDGPAAPVRQPPLRANPVTQDEMDAGSVELF